MVNSSLTYEILLYLNSFYFGMFAACEFGMGILKAINLRYEENTLGTEAGILVALCITETIRIILGRKGNLSEKSIPVLFSVILTIPSSLGVTYFLVFQAHILRLEYILCAIMLTLQVTELVFAFLFIVTMCRPPSYD